MKLFYSSLIIFAGIVSLASCKKEIDNTQRFTQAQFDSLATDTYYTTDPFNASYTDVYGIWIVYGTSGGFAGSGYPADFHKLLVKPNGIFGIVRNDSLVAYGKINVQNQTASELLVRFEPEEEVVGIDILGDNEKYISLRGNDSLDLTAPCCDRFNTHLTRE